MLLNLTHWPFNIFSLVLQKRNLFRMRSNTVVDLRTKADFCLSWNPGGRVFMDMVEGVQANLWKHQCSLVNLLVFCCVPTADRCKEVQQIREQHPNKIPVSCPTKSDFSTAHFTLICLQLAVLKPEILGRAGSSLNASESNPAVPAPNHVETSKSMFGSSELLLETTELNRHNILSSMMKASR